ncbi:MAG TPA: metalloregulator ArsR/SmtB family transcription factor [Vicinamibacterales bacterium]|nr:metalloregulator ArsR/SmtB family transcription factor [Vicinamibacterales bacterium]
MRPLQDNDVFHAIAHPVRRAILVTLRDGERAASDLAEPFRMSFPAISQHLRALEDAELVAVRRHGRHRLYRLRPKPLRNVASWVDEFAAFFGQRLDALGEYLDHKHGKRR